MSRSPTLRSCSELGCVFILYFSERHFGHVLTRYKSPLGKGHCAVIEATSRVIDAKSIAAAETWISVS